MTVGVMVDQGIRKKGYFSIFSSYKTFLIFYILCAFVVTASFKGNLLASLIRVELEPRIDTSEVICDCNQCSKIAVFFFQNERNQLKLCFILIETYF